MRKLDEFPQFHYPTWRLRYLAEVRRLLDNYETKYLFPRDSKYIIDHCDLNERPAVMAQKIIEAHLARIHLGEEILERTTPARDTTVTMKQLGEKYGVSGRTILQIVRYAIYVTPEQLRPDHRRRLTWEQVCEIRAAYKPKLGKRKKTKTS